MQLLLLLKQHLTILLLHLLLPRQLMTQRCQHRLLW